MTEIEPTSSQYIDRPDGRIAYRRSGAGPLVVLAPGMGELQQTYRHLVPFLVDAGYEAVTTDLRGHGDSDATFSSYGDAETADDLLALIDRLGAPAVVVGNSMAAASAVIAASREPDRVVGLGLLGPFVRNPPASAAQRWMFRMLMMPAWIVPVWNAYLPTLYAGRKPTDFASYRRDVVRALRRPGYRRAFALTTRVDHGESASLVEHLDVPSLVLMGTLDPDFADPAAEAAWIAHALQGDHAMIEDAGHYPQSQQPEAVAAALLPFLARVTADA